MPTRRQKMREASHHRRRALARGIITRGSNPVRVVLHPTGTATVEPAHDHDCHAAGCTYRDGSRVVPGDNLTDNPQGGWK